MVVGLDPAALAVVIAGHDALAVDTGRAWASAMVGEVRAQDRAIRGGWPGVMREARLRIMVALGTERAGLSPERLDALVRAAYASARTVWSTETEPDDET